MCLFLSVAAVATLLISYVFHTTTVDVYALSSPELAEQLSAEDAEVTIEFYDSPVDGRFLGLLGVDRDDVVVDGNAVRIEASERTRNLPRGSYLQVCIDGLGDGNRACVSSAGSDPTNDFVSCSRTEFDPDRFWLATRELAHQDVRCSSVSSPLTLAFTDETVATLDDTQLNLLEGRFDGRIADLTQMINELALGEADNAADIAELTIENGQLSVQGPAHEDDQRLSIAGSQLTITNGNTIDLSSLIPVPVSGSDDQVVGASLNGSNLVISLEDGGGATVDLSSLTQSRDNQLIDLAGNELVLSNGLGPDSTVDLSAYLDNTDSFAAVTCPAGSQHLLALDETNWSCVDPNFGETLTTIGVDAANQTIEYVDENGNTSTIDITALETTTLVNNTLAVGNIIGTYVNEDGASFDLIETVTSFVDNGDQTFTYTNEAGVSSILDVAEAETLTTLTNTIIGNPIGSYTDEDGNTFDVNETITTLIDNGDGSFSFIHEDGSTSTLSVANLETLTTMTNLLASGNLIGTYTDEDGTTFDLLETVTQLSSSGQEITFTDEAGVDTTISISDLETLTEVTNVLAAGNLIGTYVNEDGTTFDLLETVTQLSSSGQEITFTDEAGADTTISIADLETLTEVTNVLAAGNLIGTYTNEDGVAFDLLETVTALSASGQEITFTDEAGADTTISIADLETLTEVTDLLTAGHLIGTYVNEDGTTFDLLETVTELSSSGQEITFTDEAGADTAISIADLETLTEVTDLLTAGHLIGTYVNEDGVTFDVLETVTELSSSGQEITFTDEAGVDSTISIADLETLTEVTDLLTAGHLIGTYVNEDGVTFDVLETVTELSSSGQEITFTDEAGVDSTISIADLETLTEVTDLLTAGHLIGTYVNEDGVTFDVLETVTELSSSGQDITFTDEAGVDSTISIADLETLTEVTDLLTAGHLIGTYVNEDGTTFDLLETVTELSSSGQDITFTDEAGADTTISIADLETLTEVTDLLTAGHLIGTYVNEDGTTFDLLETVTALSASGQEITFTDEAGLDTTISIADLETLTEVTDLLTAGHLIGTYVNEDGTTFDLLETVTQLSSSGQEITFTDEAGADTTISIADLETLTEVTNVLAAGNLIGTYTNEDGVAFDLLETVTALSASGQEITFTDEAGADTAISIADLETLTEVTDLLTAGHLIGTYVNEDGVTFDVLETVTELSSSGQEITFTDEAGVDSTISIADLETLTEVTDVLTAGHLIGTYVNEDGTTFDLLETVTGISSSGQEITFTDEAGVDSTISISDLETLTEVTDLLAAGHLIGTYVNEDGTTFDLLETVTELSSSGQEITFTDEAGLDTTISIADLETLTEVTDLLAAGHLIGTYVNEDGTTFDLLETITGISSSGQDITFTDEAGVDTTISIADLETVTEVTDVLAAGHLIGTYTNEDGVDVDLLETVTALVQNVDGSISFTNEDGDVTTFDVTDLETLTEVTDLLAAGNLIGTYVNEDGTTFDLLETVTALSSSGQEITFTDEAGVDTTISIADLETVTEVTDVLAAGHLIGTYVNEDGATFDVLETVTELNSSGQDITFTDEAGLDTTISIADLETLTEVTDLLTAGNLIGTYVNEDGTTFDLLETVTALSSSGQEITFTDEAGVDTTISITDLETLTEVTDLLAAGHLIGTYVNEDGVTFDVLETVTELSSSGQEITFTDEAGVDTTISITDLETLTEVTDVLAAGHLIGTYTNEDGTTFDLLETITELSSSGQDITFTDEAGVDTTISISDLETLTEVTDVLAAGHLIGTYTNEDGATFDLLETVTALSSSGQNVTFTDEAGVDTTISIADLETVTEVTDVLAAGHLIGTYTNEDGTTVDLLETITSLVQNVDGSFTFTNESGDTTDFDITDLETLTQVTDLLTSGHLIGTYVNEDGTTFDLFETVTALTSAGQNITFTNESGVGTTLSIADLETLTEVSNVLTAGHLIGTYTNEDGTVVDLLETVTTFTENADGSFTFTNENGDMTTIDVAALETITQVANVLTSGHLIGTYTNETGATVDLLETVTGLASSGQDIIFTNEAGIDTTISITDLETLTTITDVLATGHLIGTYENEDGALVDLRESITSIATTGTSELAFTDEAGVTTLIDLADLETLTTVSDLLTAGNLIGTYINEDGTTFDITESVTALTDNGNGTFTFTHEGGGTSVIDTNTADTITTVTNLLANGNLIGTYENEAGATFDLNETVTALADNGDGTFTFTHEDGGTSVIDTTTIETLTTVTDTLEGNLIATYENEAGATFEIDETITELVSNGDGTLSYFDETGAENVIDISDGTIHPAEVIYEEFYAAGSDDGLGQAWGRNVRMERVANGVWNVVMSPPHPDGTDYAVNVLTQEEANLRDSALAWIEQGSKTANGFTVYLVTGDNGGTADVGVNNPFTLSINAPRTVLVENP